MRYKVLPKIDKYRSLEAGERKRKKRGKQRNKVIDDRREVEEIELGNAS